MAPRFRCPVCRSKRWHKDSLSGSVVCEEGHLLSGYVQETTETQEGPSQTAQTTRRLRKNKGRKQRPPSNDYFHGDRSQFLVYQAMQLIFREQLRIVIDELGWPAEIEAVARDLWAMLVASSKLSAAPRDFEQGEEPAGSYSGPRPGDRYTHSGRRKKQKLRGKNEDGDEESDEEEDEPPDDTGTNGATGNGAAATDGEGRNGDGGGSGSRDEESDASSYFSAADADDERAPEGARSRPPSPSPATGPAQPAETPSERFLPPPKRPPRRPPPKTASTDPRDAPRLDYTLLLLYLACITLRLPVFLSDIFRLAETYQIPYLDALLHLPLSMQSHLTGPNRSMLSPGSVPHIYPLASTSTQHLSSADSAQALLARLVNMYKEDWEVEFPEANVPSMAGRVCSMAGLPLFATSLTLSVLSHLPSSTSFRLPSSISLVNRNGPPLQPRRSSAPSCLSGPKWPYYAPGGQQDWRTTLPEIKVATAVLCVCRLLFGLGEATDAGQDGCVVHVPHVSLPPTDLSLSSSSPAVLGEVTDQLPQQHEWLTLVEKLAQLEKPGDTSQAWSFDVADMLPDEVDAYLDFFEAKIVSKEKVPSRMNDLPRFFRAPDGVYPSDLPRVAPASYLAQFDALLSSALTLSPSPSRSLSSSNAVSLLLPLLSPSGSPLDPSTLPAPLHRLLTALSTLLLPLPSSLSIAHASAAPTAATNSATYLSGMVGQLEAVLSGLPPSTDEDHREGGDPTMEKEVRDKRERESKEAWAREKNRRKELSRVWKEGQEERRRRKRKEPGKSKRRKKAAEKGKGKRKRRDETSEEEDEEGGFSDGGGTDEDDAQSAAPSRATSLPVNDRLLKRSTARASSLADPPSRPSRARSRADSVASSFSSVASAALSAPSKDRGDGGAAETIKSAEFVSSSDEED
ncbi:hypothetical protein JCM11641_005397 [Rhodosporidiobolus odoratus]